jgi:hypothetical protein
MFDNPMQRVNAILGFDFVPTSRPDLYARRRYAEARASKLAKINCLEFVFDIIEDWGRAGQ